MPPKKPHLPPEKFCGKKIDGEECYIYKVAKTRNAWDYDYCFATGCPRRKGR